MMLFNNRYGLTRDSILLYQKKKSCKSSPWAVLTIPLTPWRCQWGRCFVHCKSMDRDPKHEILIRNINTKAFFYRNIQNCNIFNDGAFEIFGKSSKPERALFLEQGKPLIFGAAKNKGIKLDGLKPVVVEIGDSAGVDDLDT